MNRKKGKRMEGEKERRGGRLEQKKGKEEE